MNTKLETLLAVGAGAAGMLVAIAIVGPPRLQAQPTAPVQIGFDASGELVVTVPSGAPPVQIDPSAGETVTVANQTTVTIPTDSVGMISFPSGGTIRLPSCKKTIRVSSAALKIMKRAAVIR
jgi:hypothetical protein